MSSFREGDVELEMTDRSIRQTAAAVNDGKIRAADLAEEALARSEQSQPVLNAFTSLDRSGALAAARQVDEAVGRGEPAGRLAGIPVGVKDLIDHAGRPNTLGSSAAPSIPKETAVCVSRLEAAGAVVIGRTNLHEIAFGFSSENHWFGPVRNPWDLRLSPGGSSGGSAASVSAGLVPASLGTDTGGSVRVPAALCGIVGLKVTHGRVSLRGVQALAPSLDTVGPFARSVADVAELYTVLAGDDPGDPWSVPKPVFAPETSRDLVGLRIGVPHPWVDIPIVSEQRQAFSSWLDGMSDGGADVVHLEIPQLVPSNTASGGLFLEVAATHRRAWQDDPDQFGPEIARRLADAMEISAEAFLVAMAWRRDIQAAALRAFEKVEVLATPTVVSLRKTIGEPAVQVGGEEVPYGEAMAAFASPVNNLGMPALALPVPAGSKPPPSVQMIGAPWSEALLLEAAIAMETAGLVATRRPPHWRPTKVDTNPR